MVKKIHIMTPKEGVNLMNRLTERWLRNLDMIKRVKGRKK